MRFVKFDKGDFLGRDATVKSLEDGLRSLCAYLEIGPDGVTDGHGGEAVLMNGAVVATTGSVAYGHSVGKILAFASVAPQAAEVDIDLEVVIMSAPRRARVLGAAAYDSENLRPRSNAEAEIEAA